MGYPSTPAVKCVTITPTVETSAYAANDVLFNPQEIDLGGSGVLKSVSMVNYSDGHIDVDLYFFKKGTNDLGTVNAGVDITDAELKENGLLGFVSLSSDESAAGAAGNLIGAIAQTKLGIDLAVEGDSSKVHVAAVTRSAETFGTASDLEFTFGFNECSQG